MKSILVTALLLVSIQSQAIGPSGPSTSGGGGAFVCRDSKGQVTSSELLDLWEAKNLLNWNVQYSKDNVDKQIDLALSRLAQIDTYIAALTKAELLKIKAEAFYLPASVALTAPVDANHLYTKPGCPLEGMLYYDSTRKPNQGLIVDNTIFKKLLTPTDVAASWVHEAVYKVYRDMFRDTSSVNARKVTACLFTNDFPCLEDVMKDSPSAGMNVFDCESNQLQMALQFYQVGETFMSKWMVKVSKLGDRSFAKPVTVREWVSHSVPTQPDLVQFAHKLVGGLSWSGYQYGEFPDVTLRKVDNMENPTKITVVVSKWDPTYVEGEDDTEFYSYRTMNCKKIN